MNKTELKNRHKELSEKEPFTEKEQQRYNKKDQSMIRNIQILNSYKKGDAIKLLKQYGRTSKQQLKTISRLTRAKISALYPKHKVFKGGQIKPPVSKHKQPTVREKGARSESRKNLQNWLKNPDNKKSKNYAKVNSASKKYLDASQPELTHGVNSEWSKNYREKIGLSRKYTGRVIK